MGFLPGDAAYCKQTFQVLHWTWFAAFVGGKPVRDHDLVATPIGLFVVPVGVSQELIPLYQVDAKILITWHFSTGRYRLGSRQIESCHPGDDRKWAWDAVNSQFLVNVNSLTLCRLQHGRCRLFTLWCIQALFSENEYWAKVNSNIFVICSNIIL